jgi:hypothetical protein
MPDPRQWISKADSFFRERLAGFVVTLRARETGRVPQ